MYVVDENIFFHIQLLAQLKCTNIILVYLNLQKYQYVYIFVINIVKLLLYSNFYSIPSVVGMRYGILVFGKNRYAGMPVFPNVEKKLRLDNSNCDSREL